jgi:hypothetical protein
VRGARPYCLEIGVKRSGLFLPVACRLLPFNK